MQSVMRLIRMKLLSKHAARIVVIGGENLCETLAEPIRRHGSRRRLDGAAKRVQSVDKLVNRCMRYYVCTYRRAPQSPQFNGK